MVCACEHECSRIYAPVCGSDGRTHANECEMKFGSCLRRRKIVVKYKGNCGPNELCKYHKCQFPPNSVCRVIGGAPVCLCNNKCSRRPRLVCGNDGRTYINECLMKFSSCVRSRPTVVNSKGPCYPCHSGRCTRPRNSYCSALPGGFTYCKCNHICPKISKPVCGSDRRTYPNRCSLDAYACYSNRRIKVVKNGKC